MFFFNNCDFHNNNRLFLQSRSITDCFIKIMFGKNEKMNEYE